MSAAADPLEATLELGIAERESAANQFLNVPTLEMNDAIPVADEELPEPTEPDELQTTVTPAPPASSRAQPTAPAAASPNNCETQRIVSVRVCALGDVRWAGADLMAVLEHHGMAHGRYQVFHRRHSDGRTLFCAASLIEPGTFDIARMPEEEFRGLTLFAVLPGPADSVQTLESLIATAAGLAASLDGVVQDSHGVTLSQQRAEAMRADVARFQSSLANN
jgi:cell division protein ZipA